jgi:formylglycine-generating enzyme required for sulfatase activity/tRNA A-37 threonylcarbamoyl transferase component Bud32
MKLAYQKSYAYALSAIAAGLAQEKGFKAFWQKVARSRVDTEFSNQVVTLYLTPFAEKQGWQAVELDEFRQQTIQTCQALVAQSEALFETTAFEFTDAELAALVKETEIATLSESVLAHLATMPQAVDLLTNSLKEFFAYQNLLGQALLFFLLEELRKNERFQRMLTHFQQTDLLGEVQDMQQAQAELKKFLAEKLTAIEEQIATQDQLFKQATSQDEVSQIWQQKQGLLARQQEINQAMPEIASRLAQAQQAWQSTYAEFIQFSTQFQQWRQLVTAQLDTIIAALPELQYTVEKIDRNVEKVLEGQGKVLEGQEVLLEEIRKLGNRLDISAQVKPRDEFSQYSGATEVLLRQAISKFNQLPNHLNYPQATLHAGSLASALGNFKIAEGLFLEIYQHSQNPQHQALAAFNLFHLYLRQVDYDNALKYLTKAIHWHHSAYVLHNIDRYPLHRLLGAGGMGCVLLCHDTLKEERANKEHFVAVKCLWESQRGEPKQIFAEAMAMARVAGDYVPEPLDYGYADNIKRERAYFITEWIEGAVDGEAWLAKQGKMDLATGVAVGIQVAQGLAKAHQHGILHLDLKPANLLLQPAKTGLTVKIIDFGLARIATSLRQQAVSQKIRSAHSQLAQQIFGTFDYAPPEQWGDIEYRQVTEKSDVFAWGKTLYRLFTGKRPQHNIRQKYLPDAPGLHELLEDCVEVNPAERPKMTEVFERLMALLPKTTSPKTASRATQSSQTQVEQITQIEPPSSIKTFEFEIVFVNAKGEIIKRESKQAQYEIEDLGNGVTLEMVSIPGGTFMMGSPETEEERYDDEGPQHRVTIQSFWMSKYPITQRQWQAVMGENPSYFKGDNRPVENVSWEDVVAFCQRLSEKTGKTYCLPSEAEWEYACRAGTTTPFYFGETITTDLVNYHGEYPYAEAPEDVYREETTEVGIFPPNAFGLYDMHGNVWEWCADPWHDNYNGAPTDGSVWREGGSDGLFALRGGSWGDYARRTRAAIRYRVEPYRRYVLLGVRLARQ